MSLYGVQDFCSRTKGGQGMTCKKEACPGPGDQNPGGGKGSRALTRSKESRERNNKTSHGRLQDGRTTINNLHFSQSGPGLGLSIPLPVGSQAGRYVLTAKGFTLFSAGPEYGLIQSLGRYESKTIPVHPSVSGTSTLRIRETRRESRV